MNWNENIVDKDLIRVIRAMYSDLFSGFVWTYFLKFSRISSYVTNPSSAAANLIAFSTSTPLWKIKQNQNLNLKIFHNANFTMSTYHAFYSISIPINNTHWSFDIIYSSAEKVAHAEFSWFIGNIFFHFCVCIVDDC